MNSDNSTWLATGAIVLVGLVLAGLFTVQQINRPESCPEKPDKASVCVRVFIDMAGEQRKPAPDLPLKWIAFNGSSTTLAALLEKEGVQYGTEIPSIGNMPAGTVASQQDGNWVFLENRWRITTGDGRMPITAIDQRPLTDGDRVTLVFKQKRVGRTSLSPKPSFIDYVPPDAGRNEKGSLTSCNESDELHAFGGGYLFGTAELPDYPRSPPVCGAHVHMFPPGKRHKLPTNRSAYILDAPITPLPVQLHLLGHGYTLVQYRPGRLSDGAVARLADRTRNHPFTYLAPYANMTAPITVTRWGMTAALESYNRTRLEQFQQAPYGILPPMQGEPTYSHATPHLGAD